MQINIASLKKTLIILSAGLLLVLTLFAGYNFIFNRAEKNENGNEEPLITSPRPEIKAISERFPLGVIIDGSKVKYYSQSDGRVYQSDLNGSNLNRISETVIAGLVEVLWSADKDEVITIFKEDGIFEKYYYNYKTNQAKKLDYNLRWIDWAPQADKIAYHYYNPHNQANNISIADPDGSNWENILDLRMNDLIVEWISDQMLGIRNKPSSAKMSAVYTLNIRNKEFTKVINSSYGLSALWSPKGDKLIFSETDSQGQKARLKFADLGDGSIQQLNFFTLPEKCVWSQDNRTLFCAVPKIIPETAKLPDDYENNQVTFKDNFWKINLDTQEVTEIYQIQEEDIQFYDAESLYLPIMEDYLLFVNKKDGLLYSLDL